MNSTPDLPSPASYASSKGSGQPKEHWHGFDGTWGGGLGTSRSTVVTVLLELVARNDNVFATSMPGVGSDISLTDRFIGGLSGWGTLPNIINTFRAWAARYLAKLIEVVGLPERGDGKLYKRLYNVCRKDSIITHEVAQELLDGYNCHKGVKIDALCCFDTVGSLGIPLTGVAKPLAIFRARKQRQDDVIYEVPSNVRYAFHCVSLHETREPYRLSLMNGPAVHQVAFPGSHGNLGWMEEGEGLVHGPLAWMIQQLHSHLGTQFKEERLEERFPKYTQMQSNAIQAVTSLNLTGKDTKGKNIEVSSRDTSPSSIVATGHWHDGNIKLAHSGVLAIIGKKIRDPGHLSSAEGAAGLEIHIGARLRNRRDGSNAVPKYALNAPAEGRLHWERRTDSSTTLELARRIEEAEVGALEARLLGLPAGIVAKQCRKPHCKHPQLS
ncbi:hypothetical protein PG985_014385 [Apiospora marii]|uniref:uncharacterized protein n=1 Tax=Apiospora marii TaxID=335849 RepID=UPI003131383D